MNRFVWLDKQVGFDNAGRIGKLKADVFCDLGYTANEPENFLLLGFIQSVYRAQNWEVNPGALLTNTATNTFVRSPGKNYKLL